MISFYSTDVPLILMGVFALLCICVGALVTVIGIYLNERHENQHLREELLMYEHEIDRLRRENSWYQ